MTLVFGDLLLEEELGPLTMEGRLAGILEEALMDEVWPTVAPMNPMLVFATLLSDRGDPAILLATGRVRPTGGLGGLSEGITGALASKGAGEPRGESGAGAGEALPDGGIGLEGEALLDLPVVLFDGEAELE